MRDLLIRAPISRQMTMLVFGEPMVPGKWEAYGVPPAWIVRPGTPEQVERVRQPVMMTASATNTLTISPRWLS